MSVYSTKSNSKTESYSGNILDLVVENVENDQKMFDSVITLDFLEAYNDAGYHVVTEAEEEQTKTNGIAAIGQKIYDAFMKAVEAVESFISNWATKIANIFANDSKTYSKYSKDFENNYANYSTKYTPMMNFNSAESKILDYAAKLNDEYKTAINKIAATTTAEDANAALKEYKDALSKKNVSADVRKIVFTGEEEKDHTISDDDRKAIVALMSNPKSAIDWASNTFKKNITNSYKKEAKAEKQNLLTAAKEGKDALARANAMNSATSAYISANTKCCNSAINTANSALMQARRVFLGASHAKAETASGEASEETKQECALIEMASDIYMESALAMD